MEKGERQRVTHCLDCCALQDCGWFYPDEEAFLGADALHDAITVVNDAARLTAYHAQVTGRVASGCRFNSASTPAGTAMYLALPQCQPEQRPAVG